MLFSVLMVIIGVQTVSFSVITNTYARRVRLYPVKDNLLEKLASLSLEKGLIVGSTLFIFGLTMSIVGLVIWAEKSFGDLMPSSMLRLLLPAVLTLSIGCQIIFTSFLIGIFQIKTGNNSL